MYSNVKKKIHLLRANSFNPLKTITRFSVYAPVRITTFPNKTHTFQNTATLSRYINAVSSKGSKRGLGVAPDYSIDHNVILQQGNL
jgi:hypothetical protein